LNVGGVTRDRCYYFFIAKIWAKQLKHKSVAFSKKHDCAKTDNNNGFQEKRHFPAENS
jgi:hypothetical protein